MVHNGVMMHYNVNYVQQHTLQRSLWNFRCFLMHPENTLQETDMLDAPPVTTHSADHVTVDTDTDDSGAYRVAKSPAFSSVPLSRLERAYGASQFLPTLTLFLQNLPGHTLQPNKFDRYNIYNAVYVT